MDGLEIIHSLQHSMNHKLDTVKDAVSYHEHVLKAISSELIFCIIGTLYVVLCIYVKSLIVSYLVNLSWPHPFYRLSLDYGREFLFFYYVQVQLTKYLMKTTRITMATWTTRNLLIAAEARRWQTHGKEDKVNRPIKA